MSAHAHHYDSVQDPGPLQAPKFTKFCLLLLVLGIIGLGLAFVIGDEYRKVERLFTVLLVAMNVPLFIGCAAAFYMAVHSVTGAQWMIPLRRLMEGLSHGIWLAVPFFIAVAAGGSYLWDWYDASARHAILHVEGGSKSLLMTAPRFIIMNGLFLVAFCFLQWKIVYQNSVKQDAGADTIEKHKFWSIIYLLVFAPAFTLMVWDLILSLHDSFRSSVRN